MAGRAARELLGPRAVRKWRLLRRRPTVFARIYIRDVAHTWTSLPDPPDYTEREPGLLSTHPLKALRQAWAEYWYDTRAGWTGRPLWADVEEAKRSGKQETELGADSTEWIDTETPLEQRIEEIKGIARDTAATAEELSPWAQQFARDKVDLAKDVVAEFLKGYHEGRAEASGGGSESGARPVQPPGRGTESQSEAAPEPATRSKHTDAETRDAT